MDKAGSNPAPSTVQWKTESHLPLWRCEGPEAVKVKSVSSGGSLVLSLIHCCYSGLWVTAGK